MLRNGEKLMSYEMMVGLEIKDNEIYAEYRLAMKPLLDKYNGGFRYDFHVSETLINSGENPINRVFAIYFGDKNQMNDFFSNSDYLKIKELFFEKSVSATTILSEYERGN